MATPEGKFKAKLIEKLEERYPDFIITKLEADLKNGIPDIVILGDKKRWATLEAKKNKEEVTKPRRNKKAQDYYVSKMGKMGYSSYVYPENEEEVLSELEDYFA